MKDDSFVEYIVDELVSLGDIESRRMFGGYGLYCDGQFFGIISNGKVYFKTNSSTRKKFEDLEMKPFSPNKKQTLKNYMEVPEDVIDDREKLLEYAQDSVSI